MASSFSPSSSSSVQPRGGWTYDVFLSFRGEDTRYTFVDHLHAALVRSGLTVFIDDKMLRVGKEISRELMKSIEESTCTVVVFSKNYADSSWCLAELAKVMECHSNQNGRLVIPVFYHVDPSDVRKQKGDFLTAFQQHEKFKEDMDRVKEWRKVLTAAANLSGHHIPQKVKEDAFISEIVGEILGNLQPDGMEDNLIGIMSRIKKLESLLDLEARQEVRMVGIWGMGGIGKTTIARALFRRISSKFDGSSFVGGVREKSIKDLCALQIKILKDVTLHESVIEDPEDGAELIQRRLCKKKVLLVLDDVNAVKQLEFLAKTHKWFGKGSRIIITTRDERLLSDTDAKYKPAILLNEQAVELFSRYAFREDSPPERYKELSRRAVRHTGRLPLAVRVLGSFFNGRQVCEWESALKRLAKTPNKEIFDKLKISFDGLEDSEQKIFLDIACFFKGHDKKRVTTLLNSFGFDPTIGIRVLTEKSLITVSNERINMHDVLQEMGLEIVRNDYPNSRLWRCEEIHDIITNKRELHAIEAIVSVSDKNSGFSVDVFEDMKKIRLLDILRDFTSSEPTTLPDGLRWLRWANYPFSSLPVAKLNKLVGLEITSGRIKHLQMGQKVLENLKFIHLERLTCKSFPDVSGAPYVERLTLFDCTRLVEVHNSLGTLRNLTYLNMSGCWNLKCLPSMIKMRLLETLDLSHCCALERFPLVSSHMEKLSSIHLNGCSNLESIPNSNCELNSLKSLHINDCMQLQELPGSMESLEELHLGYRDHRTPFQRNQNSFNFRSLTTLFYLRKLDLSWRPIERYFINDLHRLSSLEELHLSGNSELVELPPSISCLSRLKHLELNDCQQLINIHGLPSGIQVLKAGNCRSLEKIEDLTENYSWLCKIWLSGCETLVDDKESERYLDKMLCESFLEKCAAVNHVLSIAIPGSKIPRWFEEQRHGNKIALKFPPKRHNDILGFAVCGVLQANWKRGFDQTINTSEIHFTVGIDNKLIGEPQVDDINASAASTWDTSVWIVYVPFSLFQEQMDIDFGGEDWFLFAQGNLIINILEPKDGNTKIVRCGAHMMYKEDVESLHSIPDYKNSNLVRKLDDSFAYIEKFRNIDLQQIPL